MQKIPAVTDEQFEACNEFNKMICEDFLANSTELARKSIGAYRSGLRIWFNWVRENLGNKPQYEVKPREYLRYQNWLVSLGHSSADISNKRAAISSLNNYIEVYYSDEYPTFHNFINKSIKKPAPAFVHEKNPPTRAELEDMIAKLEDSDRPNKKELIAYLKFTFETGCRRAEARQIRKDIVNTPVIERTVKVKDKDGNFVEKTARFYQTPEIRCKGRGTTGKLRKLKFSDYSMDAFKEWLDARGEDDCEYMFVVKYNGEIKQVGENTFNDWSTVIFTPLLGRRFHPHALREAAATVAVLEDGKSIEAVRGLLGHESSETTKIYVCGLDEDAEADELFVE